MSNYKYEIKPDIKALLKSSPYAFLKEDVRLGNNIVFLTYGGSYAYGTNIPGSDIDIRGCAHNSKEEILLGRDFEQVVNVDTDTTVYSIKKLFYLFANANPNTIEMLGCRPQDYIYMTDIGQLILDNKEIFLSKKCIYSFGGYANSQLRRLTNKSSRKVSQSERENHIMNSILHSDVFFGEKYLENPGDFIRLYLDKAVDPSMDMEIFMDADVKHYPLRDYKSMWAEMNNIVKDYDKLGHRNENAMSKGKLAKHMMHLVRLYLMCFDILEDGKIITYREKDHDFLMSIRNGDYLTENDQPSAEFLDMVNELENKLQLLATTTELPDKPDYEKIDMLMIDIHQQILSK